MIINLSVKCDRLKHNAFSEHTSMINTSMKVVSIMLVILHLSIATDVPREKAYHLKLRLLGKIAVVKCRYEVISTKIKKNLLKAEIITWVSLEHGKQPAVLPDPNFLNDDKLEGDAALNKFFRKIYLNSDEDMRSSRAILHNQQVESNGTVLSIDWKDVELLLQPIVGGVLSSHRTSGLVEEIHLSVLMVLFPSYMDALLLGRMQKTTPVCGLLRGSSCLPLLCHLDKIRTIGFLSLISFLFSPFFSIKCGFPELTNQRI
ncbi:hypothetical protein YC2023_114856 [Brassica napus]